MCVGVRGWEWEPLRFVGNPSTPSDLSWTEYRELGKRCAEDCEEGSGDLGTRVGGGSTGDFGIVKE